MGCVYECVSHTAKGYVNLICWSGCRKRGEAEADVFVYFLKTKYFIFGQFLYWQQTRKGCSEISQWHLTTCPTTSPPSTSPSRCCLCYSWWTALTHHCHEACGLQWGYSWCCACCGFGQQLTVIHRYRMVQNMLTAPKALPLHPHSFPSPGKLWAFYCLLTVLPFPESHELEIYSGI